MLHISFSNAGHYHFADLKTNKQTPVFFSCAPNLSLWSNRGEPPGNYSPQLLIHHCSLSSSNENPSSLSINLCWPERCLRPHIPNFHLYIALVSSHVCFIYHHSWCNKIIYFICTQGLPIYLSIDLPINSCWCIHLNICQGSKIHSWKKIPLKQINWDF